MIDTVIVSADVIFGTVNVTSNSTMDLRYKAEITYEEYDEDIDYLKDIQVEVEKIIEHAKGITPNNPFVVYRLEVCNAAMIWQEKEFYSNELEYVPEFLALWNKMLTKMEGIC